MVTLKLNGSIWFLMKNFKAAVALICIHSALCVPANPDEGQNATDLDRASDEVRLVRFLLERYRRMGKIARPTYNSSTATPVWFGLRLIQLELDEREQLMRTSVWVRYRWVDEYLRWDPSEFGDLELITLPWDEVWTPDIVLVNTASTSIAERPADVMVSAGGGVFWSPHRMYRSGCMIDISNFPFDQHTCDLWFQSMSHFTWHLDLRPYPRSPWDLQTYLDSYKDSQGWQIIRNTTDRYDGKRKGGPILKFTKRVALKFSMTVNRRPGYTCHLLMLPCVFLGALTLVVFCLPPERPDRITLAMSLFGSFLVLLLILVEAAPPSAASVPQLGVYYACNMVLIMTSVFLSTSVVNVSRGGERKLPVPVWMRYVFLEALSRPLLQRGLIERILGPAVRGPWRKPEKGVYRPPGGDPPEAYLTHGVVALPMGDGGEDYQQNNSCNKKESIANSDTVSATQEQQQQQQQQQAVHQQGMQGDTMGGSDDNAIGEMGQCLVTIDKRLHCLELRLSGNNHAQEDAAHGVMPDKVRMAQEWKMVSVVMDRLYFVLYITFLIGSAVVFFPRPGPNDLQP